MSIVFLCDKKGSLVLQKLFSSKYVNEIKFGSCTPLIKKNKYHKNEETYPLCLEAYAKKIVVVALIFLTISALRLIYICMYVPT